MVPTEPCLIISIEDARKLLGARAKSMSDKQVKKLIKEIDQMAILISEMYKVLISSRRH